ncbi:MAG: FGGY-family carbohydrate kinase [Rhodoferax sp.]
MQPIITVDVGTTSVRAGLFDAQAQLLHLAQQDNLPHYFDDGRVEQDPLACRAAVYAVLKACADAARQRQLRPACVAMAAQRSSLIAVDRQGQALHPAIMWQDRRTAGLAQQMAAHNSLVYGKTGLPISPVFSALKMHWLRQQLPDLWQRTHKLLGIQDWIVHGLTGAYLTDQSFASRTNLFNLQSRQWDADLLDLFGVERHLLCDIVPPGSIVGGLLAPAAAALGLQAGLPLVSAGGDQQCAALGLGLFTAQRAITNTGTGSYLIGHADRPLLDPAMGLACNASALPGAYIVEAALLTSGAIYRWFQTTLGAQGEGFEALNAEAAQVAPGCNGLLLLPHFKGAGAPDWDPQAKGVFFNLSLDSTRGHMARAILEGIAFEMKANLERIESLCGPVSSLSVSGGLTRSDLFNQIQADVLERPVTRFARAEATSAGAWMAGAVATGNATGYAQAFAQLSAHSAPLHYPSNPAHHAVYQRCRHQSRALYQALAAPAFRAAFSEQD